MTLMEIPHGQRQNVTLLAMIASSSLFWGGIVRPRLGKTEVNSAFIVIAGSGVSVTQRVRRGILSME